MVEILGIELVAGAADVGLPLQQSFLTAVAGHRFQGVPATPGEPVRFVREPDNDADPNAVAVHNMAGRRLGYLFREVADFYALLVDVGLVQLSGRLVAPGEPGYEEHRAKTNPALVVNIHADMARVDEMLARKVAS
jgi:hypothetical protein